MDSPPVFEPLRVIEVAGDPAGEMLGQVARADGRRRREGRAARRVADRRHRALRRRRRRRGRQPHVLVLQHQQAQHGRRLPDRGRRRRRSRRSRSATQMSASRRSPRPSSTGWGCGWRTCRGSSDSLIVVSITPFGLDGPWANRLLKQPRGQDLIRLEPMRLLRQHDEHGLRHIFGQVSIRDPPPAPPSRPSPRAGERGRRTPR